MKKLYALLVALILFAGTRCFALNTASDMYPELECVHGSMNYTIPVGATLSEIAQHYRQRMAVIADVQANHITDLNRIYAGRTMIIPCTIDHAATHTANIRKSVKVASTSTVQKTVELDTMNTDQSLIAPEAIAILPLADRPFVGTPDNTTVAVVSTPPEHTPITPPRSRSNKTKKATGYRLMFTADEAKTNGIVLNHDFDTRVVLFKSERDKTNGVIAGELQGLRSRAELKGNHVAMSISLKRLPDQPFIVLVEGMQQPIDGDSITEHATAFRGRFPGPHRFTRVVRSGGKMLLNATLITFASGGNIPLGIGIGFGAPLMRMAAAHHFNRKQINAEFDFRKTELLLQPTEIVLSNSQN